MTMTKTNPRRVAVFAAAFLALALAALVILGNSTDKAAPVSASQETQSSDLADLLVVEGSDFETYPSISEAVEGTNTAATVTGRITAVRDGFPFAPRNLPTETMYYTAILTIQPAKGGAAEDVLVMRPETTTASKLSLASLPAEEVTVLAYKADPRSDLVPVGPGQVPALRAIGTYGVLMSTSDGEVESLTSGEKVAFADASNIKEVQSAAEKQVRKNQNGK